MGMKQKRRQLVNDERGGNPASVMEESYTGGAQVESARVVNVNIEDWTVDCVGGMGTTWSDLQVMSPYFHYMNGEGIYAQPEVGSMCWVCKPSSGRFATPFVLGFQSINDQDNDGFRGGRQTLNPGDVMLRTRDENFVILRRGGVLQMGATPTCQTMYIPLQNVLKQFCESYQLSTFGGDMLWTTVRDDQTTTGDALTTLYFNVKEKANDKAHVAEIAIGSHGEDDPRTLSMKFNASGEEGADTVVSLEITKEGAVTWAVEDSWILRTKKDIILSSENGVFTAECKGDATMASSNGDALVKAAQESAIVDGLKEAILRSENKSTLDAPLVHLGAGAGSQLAKGDVLKILLKKMITMMTTAGSTPVPPYSPVAAFSSAASLNGDLEQLLSTTSFTK